MTGDFLSEFETLDVNGDGVLDRREWDASGRTMSSPFTSPVITSPFSTPRLAYDTPRREEYGDAVSLLLDSDEEEATEESGEGGQNRGLAEQVVGTPPSASLTALRAAAARDSPLDPSPVPSCVRQELPLQEGRGEELVARHPGTGGEDHARNDDPAPRLNPLEVPLFSL